MSTPVLVRPVTPSPAPPARPVAPAGALPTAGPVGPAGPADADAVLAHLPCRVNDPDLWFAESPADVETAKALCVSCPLRGACLDGALERGEPWGVWGGQLLVDGGVVAAKRPRGRPRKHPVAP